MMCSSPAHSRKKLLYYPSMTSRLTPAACLILIIYFTRENETNKAEFRRGKTNWSD